MTATCWGSAGTAAVPECTGRGARLLLLVAFALVAFLFHVLLGAPPPSSTHTSMTGCSMQPPRWPELYLYSRADEVVLARDVERMVEARLAHQVLVRSVDFVVACTRQPPPRLPYLLHYPLCQLHAQLCPLLRSLPSHLTSAPEINVETLPPQPTSMGGSSVGTAPCSSWGLLVVPLSWGTMSVCLPKILGAVVPVQASQEPCSSCVC